MKKVISLILVAMLCFALAACGAPGNDFTCADVVDASAGQQRWLKSFESNIVINPQAIGAETYTDADGKLGLDIGVTDAEGNIAKALDDVLFFIEPYYANGVGGEDVFSAVFAGSPNVSFTIKDDGTNNSTENMCIITCGPENGANVAPKRYKQTLDNITEYYLVVKVTSLSTNQVDKEGAPKAPELGVGGTLTNPIAKLEIGYISAPGAYVYPLNSLAFDGTEAAPTRVIIPRLDFHSDSSYTVSEFAIKTFQTGGNYGEKAMSSVWYPYQIVSTQEYNNGTSLQTEDMITSANALSRVVSVNTDGAAILGGYLNGGSAEYDEKSTAVTVKGDGYEFSVVSGRRGTVMFYNSLEDMLAGVGGSTECISSSQYWALNVSSVKAGETFNVGVSASVTGEDTAAAAKDASKNAAIKKYRNNAEAAWNEFIATNDVEAYIENIPEGK